MKKKIISFIAGTLILFLWSAISWMVLPFHDNAMEPIPEEVIDGEMWKEKLPEDGIYHYPGMPEGEGAMERVKERLESGPRITLMAYKSGSTDLMDPMNFAFGLIFNFLTFWVLFFIASRLRDQSPGNILRVSIFLAVMVALVSDLPMMTWFMYPGDFVLANMIDFLVSFSLVGLLMGFYTFRNKGENELSN